MLIGYLTRFNWIFWVLPPSGSYCEHCRSVELKLSLSLKVPGIAAPNLGLNIDYNWLWHLTVDTWSVFGTNKRWRICCEVLIASCVISSGGFLYLWLFVCCASCEHLEASCLHLKARVGWQVTRQVLLVVCAV